MVHVPYKSTPAALQDTMAGHVQMCFADPVTSLPQVKAGTVRCLGVGNRGRYKLTPDIPTLTGQGIPDFELMTWTGVMLPAGVPAAIRTPLREAIVSIISEPAYVERQAQGGAEITPTTPEEMRRIQVAEIELYREIMFGECFSGVPGADQRVRGPHDDLERVAGRQLPADRQHRLADPPQLGDVAFHSSDVIPAVALPG